MSNQDSTLDEKGCSCCLLTLIVLALLFWYGPSMIIRTFGGGGSSTSTSTKVRSSDEQGGASETKPNVAFQEIARFSGEATKKTESFTVSGSEWKIVWATDQGKYGPMAFQIYVYSASGELLTLAANVSGKNEDYSVMRGSGTYYLEINTAQPYTIVILDQT